MPGKRQSNSFVLTAKARKVVHYELMPSLSSISFGRTSDGYFTPQSRTLTLSIRKNDGDTVIVQSIATSGKSVVFNVNSQSLASAITLTDNGIIINYSGVIVQDDQPVCTWSAGAYIWVALVSDGTIIDSKTIPILVDGAKGADGTPGGEGTAGTSYQRVYYKSNSGSAPSAPSGDVSNTGTSAGVWTKTMLSASDSYRYVYVCERNTGTTGTWGAWGPVVLFAYKPENGTSITIDIVVQIACSSMTELNQHDDSEFGMPAPWGIVVGDDDIYEYVSGWEHTAEYPDAGKCALSEHNGHLYQMTSSGWIDLGQIKGDKGDKGDNSIQYSLVVSPSEISFNSNTVGDGYIDKTVSVTAKAQKTDGSTVSDENSGPYRVYYRKKYVTSASGQETESNTAWSSAANKITASVNTDAATRQNLRVGGVEFAIADTTPTASNAVVIARAFVPVVLDGRRGSQGATGKMLYSMGKWRARDYSRTDEIVPMVHHGNTWNANLGIFGSYWFLSADIATALDEPAEGSTVWTKVQDFGVVITQGLFAPFAKLGSFVVSQDFFFSQVGILDIGSSKLDNSANPTAIYPATTGRPYYTYFYTEDYGGSGSVPAPSTTYPHFHPSLVINALTGEAWFANGNLHIHPDGSIDMQNATVAGTVKARNLYRSVFILRNSSAKVYNADAPSGEAWGWMSQSAWDDINDSEPLLAAPCPALITYLSSSQYADLFGGTNAAGLFGGLTECIGPADVVEVASTVVGASRIMLPRSQDFPGKLITVNNKSNYQLTVATVDGNENAFEYTEGNNYYAEENIAAHKRGEFYSIGSRWLFLYDNS